MKRIEQSTLDRLADGDVTAIAGVRAVVTSGILSKQDVPRLWESIITGMLKQNGKKNRRARKKLARLGYELSEMSHPLNWIYDDLLILAGYPGTPTAYAQTIKTGANVVRVKESEIREKGFDGKKYLEMAKGCLLNALRQGTETYTVETKKYAAVVLRHFEYDPEVKKTLLDVTKSIREVKSVKEAAEESLAHIRVNREGATALGDKLLLMLNYPPHAIYFEYLYNAIGTVMESADVLEKTTEVEIAVKQIATLYKKVGPAEGTFNREGLKIVKEDVENALLHALSNGNKEIREEAMVGLEAIGGNRVEGILVKIIKRDERGKEARDAAVALFKSIKKKRFGERLPLPSLPKKPKRPQRPRLRLRA